MALSHIRTEANYEAAKALGEKLISILLQEGNNKQEEIDLFLAQQSEEALILSLERFLKKINQAGREREDRLAAIFGPPVFAACVGCIQLELYTRRLP